MASKHLPPEVDFSLLEKKKLPKKSQPWDDNQLIDILLLTVKECEFLSCLSHLNPGFYKSYHPNLGHVYFGHIGDDEELNLKIALMKCNKGSAVPGGSVVAVKNAVAELRPKAVFSVGCCGSLDSRIAKLGDVIVSAKLITYATTKVTENGTQERGHSVPLNKLLANLIKSAGECWEAPLKLDPGTKLDVPIHRDGVFLSGPEKVQSQERCSQLIQRFPEAVAIEMGGEGLYAAAHDLEIEWIIIKAISEYADGNNSETESWRRFASVMAASLTADILSDPIVFQSWPHYKGSSVKDPRSAVKRKAEEPPLSGSCAKQSRKQAASTVPVKDGSPSQEELEELSGSLGASWESLARRLGFQEGEITGFHKDNEEYAKKALKMLFKWKEGNGSNATYEALYQALCHPLCQCRGLAERFCCTTE